MIRYAFALTFLYAFGAGASSCQPARGGTPPQEEIVSGAEAMRPVPVKVQRAERKNLPLRIIAAGVLKAARQAEIKSLRGGQLSELPVREGQRVSKGQLLARLDDSGLQLRLEQNQLALDEAVVNKKDLLIANGGEAESDSSVSAQKLELILTLSGYNKARHGVKQAEYELAEARILAPFEGVVADLQTKAFQTVSPGEKICTLIDPHSFEAAFSVLESEAVKLETGQTVLVSPLASPDRTYRARISTINPQVDAQGLVRVNATLSSPDGGGLFEGMNIKAVIEQDRPRQLVAPKSAVVLRSGREVVFTYDESAGQARWNYVRSGDQNDEYVAILEGLEEGALVVYEGQLNLDQGTRVVVR